MRESPREGGLAWRHRIVRILDALLVPVDPRGIVLACGFLAAAALGLWAVLLGDPIGYGYLASAVAGYFFIQTRLVPTTLWLLVAFVGAFSALNGNPPAWVEFGLGLVLAAVAMTRISSGREAEKGDSSAFVEDSPTQSSAKAEVGGASGTPEPSNLSPTARLAIRSIGNLQVIGTNGNLAPDLEDKPILAFIWKYLLACAVLGDSHVPREALADEVSPGIDDATQLVRLRKQLYHLTKDIAPELAALVQINRTHVWLNLAGTDSDVLALEALCTRIGSMGRLLDADQAEEASRLLVATGPQEFLAGFEELEHKINRGRGTAGQVVAQVRTRVGSRRANLAHALAEYYNASGHMQAAIPHLEIALDAVPERQDLARLLIAAYMQTGQTKRANELRETSGLN